MAKSLRSKTKRAFRSKKRETGVYAAAAAARLNRLNAKLIQATKKDLDGDIIVGEAQKDDSSAEPLDDSPQDHPDSMAVDTEEQPKRVSTHGPRGSRREEWRKSKGMPAKPAIAGMNRQGGIAARRKAGRSKRRR